MADRSVSSALASAGTAEATLEVTLSNELVHLLSEQMYRSPTKAIEELVVNAYDADATECRIALPLAPDTTPWVAVYDDGIGMDEEGLRNLWHIGRSNKRELELANRVKRQQIGKFGIGKLATYSIANLITYVSRSDGVTRGVTLDYREFAEDPSGGKPITLQVLTLGDDITNSSPALTDVLEKLELDGSTIATADSWTLVVLEELKPKMGQVRRRDIRWVLSSAMPLGIDFELNLNGDTIESSKASFDEVVSFEVHELPKARLETLEKHSGDGWRVEDEAIRSDVFSAGVSGTVIVTKQSLYSGKSADLARSHGFFVRVRGRLVDEADPLFGLEPLSYNIFNRFRADLHADDLDRHVTAPREGLGRSDELLAFRALLTELFYEARSRYEAEVRRRQDEERRAREEERNMVDREAVEVPLADALWRGTDVDDERSGLAAEDWYYTRLGDADGSREKLVQALYDDDRRQYRFSDTAAGRSSAVVQFDVGEAAFMVNVDHPFVQAHADPGALPLLEDALFAEVMLEIYLRNVGVSPSAIGQVLDRRDLLLRGLAADRAVSLASIAAEIRESGDEERELEVNLVIAARALGFVARHLGGAGKPDGVASFSAYPGGERRIVLEAKSSEDVPSLGAIDFAGLQQHMIDEEAEGCLLVAPSYPGSSKKEDAAAAKRAENLKISCWTVEQLADFVAQAEERHFSAEDVLDVVSSAYAPHDVASRLDQLFSSPEWSQRELQAAVIDALRSMDGRQTDRARTFDMIGNEITRIEDYKDVPHSDIKAAVRAVVNASQGLLQLNGDRVVVRGSYDELERRVAQLVGRPSDGRRESTLRAKRTSQGS